MGEPKRGANIQNAIDAAKRATKFADQGDYKHAFYHLMLAVNNLAFELENVNEILVISKIVAPEK
jgi:hypothetical protein